MGEEEGGMGGRREGVWEVGGRGRKVDICPDGMEREVWGGRP